MNWIRPQSLVLAVSLGVGGGVGLLASQASAWVAQICPNDKLYKGIHNPVTFKVNRCETPAGSAEQAVIDDAINEWNGVYGMWDRFSVADGSTKCGLPSKLSEGEWLMALVDAKDPKLENDGSFALGMAHLLFYTDCRNARGALAAHVVVNETLQLDRQTELSVRAGARHALIHELGHVLGMEHENTVMSVMRAKFPLPKVGRRSGAPNNSLGRNAETVWADDLNFAFRYHGSTAAGRSDLAVSPWKFNGTSSVLHYGNDGLTRKFCPGNLVEVKYTTVNLGRLDSFDVPVRIYWSSNDFISTDDRLLYQHTTNMPSGMEDEHQSGITVPRVSPGVYHIGVIVDPDNSRVEDDEFNNATETGLRIEVLGGC